MTTCQKAGVTLCFTMLSHLTPYTFMHKRALFWTTVHQNNVYVPGLVGIHLLVLYAFSRLGSDLFGNPVVLILYIKDYIRDNSQATEKPSLASLDIIQQDDQDLQ